MGESCCSHDVIGMCLGYFYTGCSAIGLVYNILNFLRVVHYGEPKYPEDIWCMLFFALATFISYLFVFAIEKRSPFLIVPWLVYGLFVCYISLGAAWELIGHFMYTYGFGFHVALIILIAVFVVTVVINGCVLFVKIYRENKRSREAWRRLNHDTV